MKQDSQAAYLSNLMNMQIRTFDIERSKTREFDDLSRSAYKFPKEILMSFESLLLTELTVQILSDLELYRILKNDADSGLPSVK